MSLFTIALLVALFFSVLLSAFLSGSETAITATSKARIVSKIKKGSRRAHYVLKILNNKDSVISSLFKLSYSLNNFCSSNSSGSIP